MTRRSTRAPRTSSKWKDNRSDSGIQTTERLRSLASTDATTARMTPWGIRPSTTPSFSATSVNRFSITSTRATTRPSSPMDRQEQENPTPSRAMRKRAFFRCASRISSCAKRWRTARTDSLHRSGSHTWKSTTKSCET